MRNVHRDPPSTFQSPTSTIVPSRRPSRFVNAYHDLSAGLIPRKLMNLGTRFGSALLVFGKTIARPLSMSGKTGRGEAGSRGGTRGRREFMK